MLLFYSNEITPRIEYIADLIFRQILQVEVEFTTNSSRFIKSEQPKFNYSYEKFGNEIYLKPHRLMYCRALITPTINAVWYENQKYFFESSADSVLPFDALAASFYLVTRHEEYTETQFDHLGRYPAKNSILSKYQLLQKPVVNIWAALLAEKLKEKFPDFKFPERKFKFISTIDVDNAWAYKHKGLARTYGAFLKAMLTDTAEIRERKNVLYGKAKDPYDTYDYLDQLFRGNEESIKYFFLLGDYGRYDKNVSYRNKNYRSLIAKTGNSYDTGIHPSFASAKKGGKRKLKTEIQRLEDILNRKITCSRQHFIRLQLPKTYRRLIKAGIREDYSMGYSEQPGFRAGICTPYYFYDLKRESTTNLKIIPFQVMDGTLRHYLRLSPEEAFGKIREIMQEVKAVNGTFVSIWHNETVNDRGIWKGYRVIFEKMTELGWKWSKE